MMTSRQSSRLWNSLLTVPRLPFAGLLELAFGQPPRHILDGRVAFRYQRQRLFEASLRRAPSATIQMAICRIHQAAPAVGFIALGRLMMR